MTQGVLKTKRLAWRQFAVGMVLYVITIFVTSALGTRLELTRAPLIVLGLLPMVPAVWAMLGRIRAIRTEDEQQQRIVGEALHWSLGLTGLVTFSYGLLEAYADLPPVNMMAVWPLITIFFAMGQVISRRRFR